MIPIDDLIEYMRGYVYAKTGGKYAEETIARLEELKRIREVQVPEEPDRWDILRSVGDMSVTSDGGYVAIEDYDTLRDLLKRESARADAAHEVADSTTKGVWSETLLRYAKAIGEHQALGFDRNEWKERAEAAEAKLAAMLNKE